MFWNNTKKVEELEKKISNLTEIISMQGNNISALINVLEKMNKRIDNHFELIETLLTHTNAIGKAVLSNKKIPDLKNKPVIEKDTNNIK